jgi:hypothetical protein
MVIHMDTGMTDLSAVMFLFCSRIERKAQAAIRSELLTTALERPGQRR